MTASHRRTPSRASRTISRQLSNDLLRASREDVAGVLVRLLTPLSSLGLLEQFVSQVHLEGGVSAVRWALVNNAESVAERGA